MKKSLPFIILTISLLTHFVFFGHPNKTVFDEVHFGKFISGYFTHEYFFDIHPPLGKLLISGMGYLGGFEPGFSFGQIGDTFPDNKYLWLRFLPSLAGALLPLVIYLVAQKIGISRIGSFFAGLFVALENSLVVQSRFILLDAFLLIFGFTALWMYFAWKESPLKKYLLAAGIFTGMAASVKWTGLSFLGIILVFELARLWKKHRINLLKKITPLLIYLVVVPIVVYTSTFLIHLGLLNKSGAGDAFMTPEFRKTLIGSSESKDSTTEPLNIGQKVIELNKEMYRANANLTAGHPYASKWYSWPFMQRPIYYWNDKIPDTDKESKIYFLGNPIIWWLSTVAMLYLLVDTLFDLKLKKRPRTISLLLGAGFVFNLLPFIGIKRAMFLYHYMPAYIFAILALVYLVDISKNTLVIKLPKKQALFGIVAIVAVIAFLYFAPLTYGLPQSTDAYKARAWFNSWQ